MKMIVLHAHIQKIVTDTQESTEKEKNKPKRPSGRPGKTATFPPMMASQRRRIKS